MVNRVDLLAFEFYKKKPFKGSDTGARYMVTKEEVVSGVAEDGTEEGNQVALRRFCGAEGRRTGAGGL